MTDLATYDPTGAVAARTSYAPLVEWAESARAAHQIALSLVKTSFVPEAFRNKADEATAAILAGFEVGLNPMASLRSFDVIQGVAAPRAVTLRAILQSKGHDIWLDEQTDTRAVAKGRRLGSEIVHTSEWTADRARGLGLLQKANWKNQPKAMLIARATAEVCRLTAADAIMGMAYTVEELFDDAPSLTPDEPGPAPAQRVAQRRARPRPALASALPPIEPEPATGPALPGEEDYEAGEGQEEIPIPDGRSALAKAQANGGSDSGGG